MARAIEEADCLHVLELKGNSIGVEAGQRIADSFKIHSEFKVLILAFCFLHLRPLKVNG